MPVSHEQRLARLAWARLVEPGDAEAAAFLAQVGAEQAWHEVRAGAGPARWRARLADVVPERDLEVTHRLGARVLVPGDEEWPACLDDLGPAAPVCLWVRGPARVDELVARSVSVVGCRACSSYGEHVTTELGSGFALRGVAVVSGGAYGIDACAHRVALAAGGATLAVLACGVDRIYPRGNDSLLREVAARYALVSELPPGSAPTRWRFLERNRLIAALTPVTVVVEAAWRSGALSTARRAADLGRLVAAVPGPVTSATSAGPHALIRDGATCVTDVDEVLELVAPLSAPADPAPATGVRVARAMVHDGLDAAALRVFDALPLRRGVPAEALARTSGLDTSTVRALLARLELSGHAGYEGGLWRRRQA
ncbi:MAG: DNA-processing protein DprA [Kineosporiaceae bacterium]